MKNQFLRGVRLMSAALALVLLGVGGVMATPAVLNLSSLDTATAAGVLGVTPTSVGIFTIAYDTSTVAPGSPEAGVKKLALSITSTSADSVVITGKLKPGIKIKQLILVGAGAKKVFLDVDTLIDASAAISQLSTATAAAKLTSARTKFIDASGMDTVIIQRGYISTKADTAITVGYDNSTVAKVIYVGDSVTTLNSGKNSIKIASSGRAGGAAIAADSIVVWAPGQGNYDVTSDNGIALLSSGSVRVNGGGKVSLSAGGTNVIWAGDRNDRARNGTVHSDSAIIVKNTSVQHIAPTSLSASATAFASLGRIYLENVTLGNKAAALSGMVASGHSIWVIGGSYAAATGSSGSAIYSSGDTVWIAGTKITSSGATGVGLSGVIRPDYVVSMSEEGSRVYVVSTPMNVAEVAYTATAAGKNVGAVKADTVYVRGSTKEASVRVNADSGTVIKAYAVYLDGSSAGTVTVSAATGKAIFANGPLASDSVVIYNSTVRRTGTPSANNVALVDVTNGTVVVRGEKSNVTTKFAAAPGPNSIAISAISTADKRTPSDHGKFGKVRIEGGTVTGVKHAVYADSVIIGAKGNTVSTTIIDATKIEADSTAIFSFGAVGVNNRNAKIYSVAGGLSHAVIQADSSLIVTNADSIVARGFATALKTTNRSITVNGGSIRSNSGTAISSSGSGDTIWLNQGSNSRPVSVTSGTTSATNYVVFANGKVRVGKADVRTTGATNGMTAIRVTDHHVSVDSITSRVSSNGNTISVKDGNVTLDSGVVASTASSAATLPAYFAAVNVTNGRVYLKGCQILAEGAASGVYLNSDNSLDTVVASAGKITVRGLSSTVGAIRVTGRTNVRVTGDSTQIIVGEGGTASQAFGIESVRGEIKVDSGALVKVADGVGLRSTSGGNINIVGKGVTNTTYVTGNKLLVRSIRPAGAGLVDPAGRVTVSDPNNTAVYGVIVSSKGGPTIKADDTVEVTGLGARVSTEIDTAISTLTTTRSGVVIVDQRGTVWAYGSSSSATYNPIAIASRFVYVKDGGKVYANEDRLVSEDEEANTNSRATAIFVPAQKTFLGQEFNITGKVEITNSSTSPGDVVIRAFGKGTAINCADSSVEVVVDGAFQSTTNHKVLVSAGNMGTAIKSVGNIYVTGDDSKYISDSAVSAHIRTGNRKGSVAITNMNAAGARKFVRLKGALVEGGNDGAIGIATGAAIVDSIGTAVILVRNGSKGIQSAGGVYIENSYVEVLATEDDTTGTAIEAREIRISGVRSEVHSKGKAVEILPSEGAKTIEVSGRILMSGTVMNNMSIGSSTLSGTSGTVNTTATIGTLSMGSDSTNRLSAYLSKYSELTDTTQVRRMIIPANVTLSVTDNGSSIIPEEHDLLWIFGTVTTIGNQAGASFVNGGKVVVQNGGNVKFNLNNVPSFSQDNGTLVLKTGSKLRDSTLVHYSSSVAVSSQRTFIYWARLLSTGDRAITDSKVIIPPKFADSSAQWGNNYTRSVDTVYTVVDLWYPLDALYTDYVDTLTDVAYSAKDGARIIYLEGSDEGGLLTRAGTFKNSKTVTNEAGTATQVFNHIVRKVPVRTIQTRQVESFSNPFFQGYLISKDGNDTTWIRSGDAEVAYTGNVVRQEVSVRGDTLTTFDGEEYPGYFSGLGEAKLWYEGDMQGEGTYYLRNTTPPTNVGKYFVYATFNEGENFEAVSSESDMVYIGQFTITPGTIESVFGLQDYYVNVDLYAGEDYNGAYIKAGLPNLSRYGAAYFREDITPTGSNTEMYVDGSARIQTGKDTLEFRVNKNSVPGQFITFELGIDKSFAQNFDDAQFINVRVNFRDSVDMLELTPAYVTVYHIGATLNGFVPGRKYEVSAEGGATVTFTAATEQYPIDATWFGKSVHIVALPNDPYKKPSLTHDLAIGVRPEAPTGVTVSGASSATAKDGRLVGTTSAMEYRLGANGTWTAADGPSTTGLGIGSYSVRFAGTLTTFPSEAISLALVGVAESNREIPTTVGGEQAAVVPVAKVTAEVTVGPNPVAKSAVEAGIFWSGSKSVKGTLLVFDAVGNKVASVSVSGGKGKIGSWKVANVAEGTYLLKGVLTDKDGNKVKVSTIVGVR